MQNNFESTEHILERQRVPTPVQVKNKIKRIGELGLKVNISEMDVRLLCPRVRLKECGFGDFQTATLG